MNWEKIEIINQDGEKVDAQAPIIISASRSTDIPAFYAIRRKPEQRIKRRR
jgi:hypothetical protein